MRSVEDHLRASPVMNATDDAVTHFYIHTLTAGPDGQLGLRPPQRVEIAGEKNSQGVHSLIPG